MEAFFGLVARAGVSPLGVAIIAAIAALVGTGTSLIVSRRTVYINSVTAERSKWIEKLRNNIADILAIAYEIHKTAADLTAQKRSTAKAAELTARADALFVQLHRVISVVSLQLNPESKIDRNILVLIGFLRTSRARSDMGALTDAQALIMRHSQWLLKFEWETVKYEASGPFRRMIMVVRRWRRNRNYSAFSKGRGSIESLR